MSDGKVEHCLAMLEERKSRQIADSTNFFVDLPRSPPMTSIPTLGGLKTASFLC